jgi:hypothetical protein
MAQQEAEPADQAEEVVSASGRTALMLDQNEHAHPRIGLTQTHPMAAPAAPASRAPGCLILGVTPCFWPEMKTLNL